MHRDRVAARLLLCVAAAGLCCAGSSLGQRLEEDRSGGKAPSNRAPAPQKAPAAAPPAPLENAEPPAPPTPLLPAAILIAPDGRGVPIPSLRFEGAKMQVMIGGEQRLLPLRAAPPLFFDPYAPAAQQARRMSAVILSGGERITGAVARDAAVPEQLIWRSRLLGRLAIPFQRIESVQLQSPESTASLDARTEFPDPAARDADVVTLTNGDRIEGVVLAIDSLCTIDPFDGAPIDLPLERVASIHMVGPQRAATGPIARLRGGDRLAIDAITTAPNDRLHLRREGRPLTTIARSDLLALTPSARASTPLSRARSISERADATRWRPAPARFVRPSRSGAPDGADLILPGATRLNIESPEGAVALLGRVTLGGDERFASARVTVWTDRRPVTSLDLDHRSPDALLLAPLDRPEFLLTVSPIAPGENASPVRLIDPIFILGPFEAEAEGNQGADRRMNPEGRP